MKTEWAIAHLSGLCRDRELWFHVAIVGSLLRQDFVLAGFPGLQQGFSWLR